MELYLFVFLGLFTPGPNIILVTASGARFGIGPTMPHIVGIAVGVGIIAAVSALGVTSALLAQPELAFIFKLIAVSWILWMAWGLFKAANGNQAGGEEKPFTFLQAVLFQWVNPKIWAIALAASAGYGAGQGPITEAARLFAAFCGINFFVCLFWTYAGASLRKLLNSPAAWSWFRRVMGILLAASASLVFI